MNDPMNEFNLDADVLAQYEKLASSGFNLLVPEGVARDNKQNARWQEAIVIESASRTKKTGNKGQDHTQIIVKSKVIGFGNSESVGKPYTIFLTLNFGAVEGKGIGTNDQKNEVQMTAMSVKKMRGLLAASGIDTSAGIQSEVFDQCFPLADAQGNAPQSAIAGQTVIISLVDKGAKKRENGGGNQQDVEGILPYSGGA